MRCKLHSENWTLPPPILLIFYRSDSSWFIYPPAKFKRKKNTCRQLKFKPCILWYILVYRVSYEIYWPKWFQRWSSIFVIILPFFRQAKFYTSKIIKIIKCQLSNFLGHPVSVLNTMLYDSTYTCIKLKSSSWALYP